MLGEGEGGDRGYRVDHSILLYGVNGGPNWGHCPGRGMGIQIPWKY